MPQIPSRSPAPKSSPAVVPGKRPKRREDTSVGCRALAADDLRRAEQIPVEQAGWRYRHSATAWLARADMLDRLEAKFEERARRAAS